MTKPVAEDLPLRSILPAVLLVVSIFFLNFLSRIALAPLMPVVEADLGFSHAHAGAVFFGLGVGNGIGLFLSGFLSRRIGHRSTVGWSAVIIGSIALLASQSWSPQSLQWSILFLGIGAGLYLPSGIAAVTSLVRREDWGKTLALHEMAPNTAFVVAPLLAEALLLWFEWRSSLILLGGSQLLLGFYFLKKGRGGDFPGVTPFSSQAKSILRDRKFWLLICCFVWAIGIALGPYSMLPLYLTGDHGFSRETANQLLAASRFTAIFVTFLGGWLTDRLGAKPVMTVFFTSCGLTTILLGMAEGWLLVAAVMVQPLCTVLFFTPAFTLMSKMFDHQERSVAIGFMGPINATFGVGVIPWVLGILGDQGHFSTGFMVLGMGSLLMLFIIPLLPKEQ